MDEREKEAVRLLARVCLEAGKFAVARDLLRGVAAAEPADAFAARNLILAHIRLGEYAEAEPLARRWAGEAKGGERAAAHFFHAYALWGLGKLAESKREVERYAACLAEAKREADQKPDKGPHT